MSTVFDVIGIAVEGGPSSTVSNGIDEVVITDAFATQNVTVTVPETVETVTVQVPGIQGAPGVKNVYVSAADPSKDPQGNTVWGPEETNYVWIKPL